MPLRVGVGTLFDTTSSHHRRDIVDRFKALVSTLALVVVRSTAQHLLIQSTKLLHDRSSSGKAWITSKDRVDQFVCLRLVVSSRMRVWANIDALGNQVALR